MISLFFKSLKFETNCCKAFKIFFIGNFISIPKLKANAQALRYDLKHKYFYLAIKIKISQNHQPKPHKIEEIYTSFIFLEIVHDSRCKSRNKTQNSLTNTKEPIAFILKINKSQDLNHHHCTIQILPSLASKTPLRFITP